ncbi:MAG: imidazole glycerol phosphate synthase subunit HisF [Firmicutes bacterium]|jgi:cyclase|nr:imidazole glycerol phosphate synthase subunit HisF [Bacillota bacterium]HPU01021.1 imidazole glycerol phosphate synthase subunit HisF [Bacillota bacterium]
MQYRRIIPCLDLLEGRLVKGVKFVDLQDAGDPVERALFYAHEGADELFLLDTAATATSRPITQQLLREVSSAVGIPLAVGGGIDSMAVIDEMLQCGAAKVSIGSAALENPAFIEESARQFGSSRIVVAIDARRTNADSPAWEVFSKGGRRPTGRNAADWAREAELRGAGEILVTSIDADGTQEGYDLGLLQAVTGAVDIPVIASGGAGKPDHLYDALTEGGADAVLAASILHQDRHTIGEIKEFLASRGLPVRR